jgi:hypothetical protein
MKLFRFQYRFLSCETGQNFLAIAADQTRREWMFAGIIEIDRRLEPAATRVIAHAAPQAAQKFQHR